MLVVILEAMGMLFRAKRRSLVVHSLKSCRMHGPSLKWSPHSLERQYIHFNACHMPPKPLNLLLQSTMASLLPPLLRIPAELRLAIYEHVYPTTHDDTVDYHLVMAAPGRGPRNRRPPPPTKGLILTNKLAYHEAKDLYKTSFQSYWTSNKFILHAPDGPANDSWMQKYLLLQRKEDLNHIEKLTIHQTGYYNGTFTLIDNRGGWCIEGAKSRIPGQKSYRRYRHSLRREGPGQPSLPDPTKVAWDGHGDEASLKEACTTCRRTVDVVDQILALLGLQLSGGGFAYQ